MQKHLPKPKCIWHIWRKAKEDKRDLYCTWVTPPMFIWMCCLATWTYLWDPAHVHLYWLLAGLCSHVGVGRWHRVLITVRRVILEVLIRRPGLILLLLCRHRSPAIWSNQNYNILSIVLNLHTNLALNTWPTLYIWLESHHGHNHKSYRGHTCTA